jgi:hypothetical protein
MKSDKTLVLLLENFGHPSFGAFFDYSFLISPSHRSLLLCIALHRAYNVVEGRIEELPHLVRQHASIPPALSDVLASAAFYPFGDQCLLTISGPSRLRHSAPPVPAPLICCFFPRGPSMAFVHQGTFQCFRCSHSVHDIPVRSAPNKKDVSLDGAKQ